MNPSHSDALAEVTGVLVVIAHPDDESFGLGAVLAELITRGARATVLCFTHGEASTLHTGAGELATIRAEELRTAGATLGVSRIESHGYPDGALTEAPLDELAGHVRRLIDEEHPSHLLAFDLGGVTGHPDHHRATEAALAAAAEHRLPVLGWTIPNTVAARINAEFGTAFIGRPRQEAAIALRLSRRGQLRAIECHRSQSTDNPVLRRRLELLGEYEYLRPLNTGS